MQREVRRWGGIAGVGVALFASFAMGSVAGSTAVDAVYTRLCAWVEGSGTVEVRASNVRERSARGRNELLRVAFTEPLVERPLLPAVTSVEELESRIDALHVPSRAFFGAYDRLEIGDLTPLDDGIVRLEYRIDGARYEAIAYRERKGGMAGARAASLVIPGTGLNQSYEIHERLASNASAAILPLLAAHGDSFVLVKPNEGVRAIHDGRKKLNYTFVTNALLNRGGSYSARYLIDALALAKYLAREYPSTAIVGLSQGGTAALYCSLQARPTVAVVASGWSVINGHLLWSGFGQIVVPGLDAHYGPEQIERIVASSPTKFLFTYGRREEGTYGVEAEEQPTKAFFSGCSNVSYIAHDGGHQYPIADVARFLDASLGDGDAT